MLWRTDGAEGRRSGTVGGGVSPQPDFTASDTKMARSTRAIFVCESAYAASSRRNAA
jgi:hypothetical protein